jgi:hypothetical protein
VTLDFALQNWCASTNEREACCDLENWARYFWSTMLAVCWWRSSLVNLQVWRK